MPPRNLIPLLFLAVMATSCASLFEKGPDGEAAPIEAFAQPAIETLAEHAPANPTNGGAWIIAGVAALAAGASAVASKARNHEDS